tara:strand:+ start:320 stop:655 length:336 start_codon:yes stop_codon:yes gene_type:complete
LEIHFNSREIRRICTKDLVAKAQFGEKDAKRLQNRISDIMAATTVNDLFVGSPEETMLGGINAFQLSFGKDRYLVFSANHLNNPLNSKGKINWNGVSRVKIISVGDLEYAG